MSTKNSNRVCMVAGCDRRHMARGLCHGHYSRWYSAGKPQDVRAFARAQTLLGSVGTNGHSRAMPTCLREREQAIHDAREIMKSFDELVDADRHLARDLAEAMVERTQA